MTSALQRMVKALKRHGFRVTLIKLYIELVDRWFDFRYDVETCCRAELQNLNIKSVNRTRGTRYEPARVVLLRKLFRYLKSAVPMGGVIVDLGSGKGRVLMVASEFGFREARGIEFSPELCSFARSNCARFRQAARVSTEFHVVEIDVVDYEIRADEDQFLMFNPFDEVILDKVLDNMERSLADHPRTITICLHNPVPENVMDHRERFVRVSDLNWWGYRTLVYTSAS